VEFLKEKYKNKFKKKMPKGRRRTSVQILRDSRRSPIETENLDFFSKLGTKIFRLSIMIRPSAKNRHPPSPQLK
jgi:hypothetical protein